MLRSYSFIRGQNAPIDANTLAERASRRLKAVEFQNAIKEQLLERERLKRVEEEKRLMEERVQEDRIRKQLQIEQERVEQEQRKQQEKLEAERKRSEMMRDAIEKAKQAAELEKLKRKRDNAVSAISDDDIGQREEADAFAVAPPNRLPALQPKLAKESLESAREEMETGRREIEIEPAKERPPSVAEAKVVDPIDDGEKILIGSPIRLRKKTVHKSGSRKHSIAEVETNDIEVDSEQETKKPASRESDIDGIALVLQSIPPIVPMINNDLLSLNQNLSTMNNIQLAVMLAHQMQYFSPNINAMAMNSHPFPERLVTSVPPTPQSCASTNEQPIRSQTVNQATVPVDSLPLINDRHRNTDVHAESNTVDTTTEVINEREICRICEKKKRPQRSVSPVSHDQPSMAEPAHDRTFTRGMSVNRRETAAESDTSLPSTSMSGTDMYSVQSPPPTPPSQSTVDAATQTDQLSDSNCCCQHHQYHHHHVYVKEIPSSRSPFHVKGGRDDIQAIAFDILSGKRKETDSDPGSVTTPLRSKQPADTKHESKEPKEPMRIEDRPKWGVNRPVTQYVKASERDPIYLRNKRKKLKKRSTDDMDSGTDNNNTMISRSTSPSLIASCSAAIESPTQPKPINEKISRNICTEILPIKTDVNGRVYLNFHEASMMMSEDEVKQQLKSRHSHKERIMNRRRTSDDILKELKPRRASEIGGRDKLDRTRRSNTDVDLEAV